MSGIGFDAGSYNLVCACRDDKRDVVYKREVNAFVQVPLENRFVFNMMKNAGVPLIEREEVAYALGEAAVNMAYTLSNLELKRPMQDGCVNPKERDAFQILSIMIHSLLEGVKKDKQVLYYCVPANAINRETDADYHQKILQSIFKGYKSEEGYSVDAHPINEGLALVYAELSKKAYTGIGVSCLCPGTKINTDKGIVNIEDVREGDNVIGHDGKWHAVYGTVRKSFRGMSTQIRIIGCTPYGTNYRFVDDHKIYVRQGDRWVWSGCESVKPGDVVGEPVLQKDDSLASPVIVLTERVTCSKVRMVTHIPITPDICRLIGLFLGDGSVSSAEGCVQFDFATHEKENIADVHEIIMKSFGKQCSDTKKGDNCVRVKCYSRALCYWFKNHCYRPGGKKIPFGLPEINDECCRQLVKGLLHSDGVVGDNSVYFYNTDTVLVQTARQAFARCGIGACVYARSARTSKPIKNGRSIRGGKPEWTVGSGSSELRMVFPEYNLKPYSTERRSNKVWVADGFICSRVLSVLYHPYDGEVYDLQVSESHSFSGLGLAIKNCGSGMINLCFAMFGNPVFQFSLVNSGDWIDKMAAKATGESVTFINREKHKIDLTKPPANIIQRAIQTQYRIMIETAVKGIKDGLSQSANSVRVDKPVDFVVAGGTSLPKGFVSTFKEVIAQAKLSIPTGEIIQPADPLFSVSRGCLLAAEASMR